MSAPPRQPAPAAATLLVWGVFALALAAVFTFVARFSVNTFYYDDWKDTVPLLASDDPPTPGALWRPHNEHRIPLPRLVQFAVFSWTGNDVRGVTLFNAAVLAVGPAALLWAASRLPLRSGPGRRGLRLGDVVVPLALLHLGSWDNLLWAFQIQFALTVTLACCLLAALLLLGTGAADDRRLVVALVACLALLLLCGTNGVAFAVPFVPYLVYLGQAMRRRKPEMRRTALLPWAGALGAVVYCALYFIGLPRGPFPPADTLWEWARGSLEFLMTGFGPAVAPTAAMPLAGLVVLGFGFWAAAAALRALPAVAPEERPRLIGLLAFGAVVVLMAAAVGYGRGGMGPGSAAASRYCVLAALLLIAARFAFELYGGGPPARWAGTAALAALVALAYPANAALGLSRGRSESELRGQFLEAVRAGSPFSALGLYGRGRVSDSAEDVARGLGLLRDAKIEPYTRVQDDPPTTAVRVPLGAPRFDGMEPAGAGFRAVRPGGNVAWRLAPARPAYVVRLSYSFPEDSPPGTSYRVSVRPSPSLAEREAPRGVSETRFDLPLRGQATVTLAPNRTIDEVRVTALPAGGGALPAPIEIRGFEVEEFAAH